MNTGSANPVVTVVIATYNWSTVLPFSIGSVLRQTYTNFELLVVGDGCTDDSQKVVESINDERVRWINLPSNTGHQSEPNNEGLKQARGELIAYLGHDDLWLPHHLQYLVEAINNGSDLAYGIVGVVNLQGGWDVPFPSPLAYERGMWIPPTGVLHKREITQSLGGWKNYRELSVNPELELWQRAYDANYKLTLVPRFTAIKFPAAYRRDAYKNRSCAEQSLWTRKMVDEPNFEITQTMSLLMQILEEKRLREKHVNYRDLVKQLLVETGRRSIKRISTFVSPSSMDGNGEVIDRIRKFKGLD